MSETELTQIDVKAGINRDQTEYSTQGQYVDGQWVRFRSNKAEKMGGFIVEPIQEIDNSSKTTFTGVPRSTHTWLDLDENKLRAVGTHSRLQLLTNSKIYDITPIETSVTRTDNVTVTSGSTQAIVSVSVHTRQIGDWVEVSCASSIGNVLLRGMYEVTSVDSVDYFYINAVTTAALTSTGGGTTNINFLIPSGARDSGSPTGGWGGGSWGTPGVSAAAGWNNPRGSSVPKRARVWSLDNWGEDLVSNPRGGGIYVWDKTNGPTTRSTLIQAAPSVVNTMLVAEPSRHMMAFGCTDELGDFDPLLVRWSDAENYNVWTASIASEAGSFRLKGGNYIVGAVQSSKEILAVTDNAVHRLRYVGGDFIWSSDQVGSDAGLVAQDAIVDVNGRVLWMGYNSFFDYDQRVRKLPCTLLKDTFDTDRDTSLNFSQKEKVVAGQNSEYNEVIWFYPSRNSIENDRYIIYNYLENTWYGGRIERTCWDDVNIFEKPYACDSSGVLYTHEVGKDANGQPLPSFIETGEIDINQGNAIMFVDKFVPDFIIPNNKPLEVTLSFRKYPNQPLETKTYTITNNTSFINMRARARRTKIKYSVDGLGSDFEIGLPEFGIKPDGRR